MVQNNYVPVRGAKKPPEHSRMHKAHLCVEDIIIAYNGPSLLFIIKLLFEKTAPAGAAMNQKPVYPVVNQDYFL